MSDLYLHIDGKQTGPFSDEQVRAMLAEGKISGDTLAWSGGMAQWSTVARMIPGVPVDSSRPIFVQPQGSGGVNGCVVAAVIVTGLLVVVAVMSVFVGILIKPILAQVKQNAQQRVAKAAPDFAGIQQSTLTVQTGYLADVLKKYATDHNGAYPDGSTSTQVFQKLLDAKYVFDPTVFYFPMKGKTKPTSTQLSADNVCFDMTAGATAKSSPLLPLVFTTGYTITYAAGTDAVGDGTSNDDVKGIAVTYLNGSSAFQVRGEKGNAPHIIDPGFDAGGEAYRQLKP